MEFKEFRRKVLRIDEPRRATIRNSYGVYDAYKYIRKNKWFNIGRPVTEKEFYAIIRTVNKISMQELLDNKDIKLPCRMGTIEIRKKAPKIELINGKAVVGLPVDWYKTLEVWSDDKEFMGGKKLVYSNSPFIYKIKYNKSSAVYNNKSLYNIRFNRSFKKNMKDVIINDGFECYN